ncbi:MAG TPA: DUF2934 domain-containing protein [Planctomycetaceae bacterium]|jgi:hypothetical protein
MPSTTAILAKPAETALTTRSKTTILSGPAIPPHHGPAAIEDTIRHRAYLKWVTRGMPEGDGVDFWLEAEQELLLGK